MADAELSREQVLAHRVTAHGLDRRVGTPTDLAVLDLGVQTRRPVRWRRRCLCGSLRPCRPGPT